MEKFLNNVLNTKGSFQWGDTGKNWKVHFLLGFFFIVSGIIGLLLTPLATLSTILLFASFMFIGGIFQVVEGLKAVKGWSGRLGHIVAGFLYVIGGLAAIFNPVAASFVLTLFLAISIFVSGIIRVVIAFSHKEQLDDWGILLVSGLASVAVAFLIWFSWPYSVLWTLGLLISIDLIFNGWSHVVIALAAKRIRQQEQEVIQPTQA